jgi:Alternative complex III, ActD subunit
MEHAPPVGRTYVLGRFPTGEALVEACYKVREKGFEAIDTHSPYPLHGGDEALGLGRSRVPGIALAGGLTGLFGGYLMMVYMNGLNWPLNVGGRPPHAPPSFIPITFETTVLLTSLAIFFGLLVLFRFPQPYHPVFEMEEFRSAASDGFWMSVALPPGSDGKDATALLGQLGAKEIGTVQEALG